MGNKAKAVKAVAKAAEKIGPAAIAAGTELASWGAKVVGTIPEDLAGLAIGDYLHELRIRNLDRIRRKTEEILKTRRVTEPKSIGLRLARPTFEAASEEDDEALQDLWARLLANAMDPNRDTDLRGSFIEALRKIEPIDAAVLNRMAETAIS